MRARKPIHYCPPGRLGIDAWSCSELSRERAARLAAYERHRDVSLDPQAAMRATVTLQPRWSTHLGRVTCVQCWRDIRSLAQGHIDFFHANAQEARR